MYVLHNYFRSSTSFRVRDYEYKSYALLDKAHRSEAYLSMNPDGLVPTLETPDGFIGQSLAILALETPDGFIGQSLAILEYLDEKHPEPALLPSDAKGRARVRSLAHSIALDIHPVNNLRVLQYLGTHFSAEQTDIKTWFGHWATQSLTAVEQRLATEHDTGQCCHGDKPGLADICLVAQMINNTRFDVATEPFPTINRIVEHCLAKAAFKDALPMNQPDAPAS